VLEQRLEQQRLEQSLGACRGLEEQRLEQHLEQRLEEHVEQRLEQHVAAPPLTSSMPVAATSHLLYACCSTLEQLSVRRAPLTSCCCNSSSVLQQLSVLRLLSRPTLPVLRCLTSSLVQILTQG
jgi:hypothetical protein